MLIVARSKVCHAVPYPVTVTTKDKGILRADKSQPSGREFPKGFWD